jgi:hypothetical protein
MRLLESFNRYLVSGEGDVKQLQGKENEFRLRLGDYCLCFTPHGESAFTGFDIAGRHIAISRDSQIRSIRATSPAIAIR